MNFYYIIVDKYSDVPPEHKRAVKRWFFFQFFMVALCTINIIFFICNWGDLRLQINDTTNILLTIIGFLFAFAGINIYSIFNTNIETEKAKMIELQKEYSHQMETAILKMSFYDSVHQLQLYSQLIFNLSKTNSQIIIWVDKIKEQCECIKLYIEDSKKHDSVETYEHNQANLLALYRGLKHQQRSFLDKNANSRSNFFNDLDVTNRNEIIDSIKVMFASLDFLEPDDFDDDFSDKASNTTWLNSFWDRIKKIGTKLCLLK